MNLSQFRLIGLISAVAMTLTVETADRRSQLYLSTLDWNSDGVQDVVVLKSGLNVLVNKGVKGTYELLSPEGIKVPLTQGYLFSFWAVDWNHDGDEDLVYQSAAGDFCFAERSFLKFGYRPAQVQSAETRNP